MTINEKGFLSKDISDWIVKYHEDFSQEFELAEEINEFAQSNIFTIKIHDNKPFEILIGMLFIRALSSYQGVIILSERGMINEATIICRTLMETLFATVACIKNDEIAEKYILNSLHDKLKSINKLISYANNKKDKVLIKKLNEKKISLKKEIGDYEKEELNTEYLSIKADLHNHYLTAYHLFSDIVHLKTGALENHIDPELSQFKWGPSVKGIDKIIMTAIDSIMQILNHLLEYFNIDKNKDIEKYFEQYKKIMIKNSNEP